VTDTQFQALKTEIGKPAYNDLRLEVIRSRLNSPVPGGDSWAGANGFGAAGVALADVAKARQDLWWKGPVSP
jgi:hypothetical protein